MILLKSVPGMEYKMLYYALAQDVHPLHSPSQSKLQLPAERLAMNEVPGLSG
mgnify:CR=1 FL=1